MQKFKKINWNKVFLMFFLTFTFLFSGNVLAQNSSNSSSSTTGTNTTTDSKTSLKFENPIKANSIDELLTNAMAFIQSVVAIIAIFVIVVAGVMYIAGGESGAKTGKEMIKGAVIGLIIAFSAPALIKDVYEKILKKETPQVEGVDFNQSIFDIFVNTTKAILDIIAVLTILMIIVGGVMLISSGDSDRTKTAKNIITSAITGLIIALLSLVIVNAIAGIFK